MPRPGPSAGLRRRRAVVLAALVVATGLGVAGQVPAVAAPPAGAGSAPGEQVAPASTAPAVTIPGAAMLHRDELPRPVFFDPWIKPYTEYNRNDFEVNHLCRRLPDGAGSAAGHGAGSTASTRLNRRRPTAPSTWWPSSPTGPRRPPPTPGSPAGSTAASSCPTSHLEWSPAAPRPSATPVPPGRCGTPPSRRGRRATTSTPTSGWCAAVGRSAS